MPWHCGLKKIVLLQALPPKLQNSRPAVYTSILLSDCLNELYSVFKGINLFSHSLVCMIIERAIIPR